MTPQTRAAVAAVVSSRILAESPSDFEQSEASQIARLTKPSNAQTALSFSKGANIAATATYMQELMLSDLRPRLSKVSVPLLEIGPFDSTVDPKSRFTPMATLQQKQTYYASLLADDPTAKVVMIDDSRHFIMLDQPEKLFAAIDAFLESL
jgi:pimeloyl-ACP methyl ester carboxylesterase